MTIPKRDVLGRLPRRHAMQCAGWHSDIVFWNAKQETTENPRETPPPPPLPSRSHRDRRSPAPINCIGHILSKCQFIRTRVARQVLQRHRTDQRK
jgi:hypothetical protein